MKYQRYKRGQIVVINFSPSMGSEMRGKHFGIVLTKNDSPNNGVLTVIPLSSKEKPYYLDIGNIVIKHIYPKILRYSKEFTLALEDLKQLDGNNEENIENVKRVLTNFAEMMKVINMYKQKNKRSYALVQNISTLSKLRIMQPVNQYDPIKDLIVDNLVLDLIDNKIKELFINERK